MKMDIRAIRSEADYDWALRAIETYFDDEPKRGTPEAERFDVLAALIEAYEAKRWPIDAPDAVAALEEVMEQRGLTQADLGRVLGSRSRASEVMGRKRPLTLAGMRRIAEAWGVPSDLLVRIPHNQAA